MLRHKLVAELHLKTAGPGEGLRMLLALCNLREAALFGAVVLCSDARVPSSTIRMAFDTAI
jgi:hypothetical protein